MYGQRAIRQFGLAVAVAALCALCLAASPDSGQANRLQLSPDEIYLRCVKAMKANAPPPYVTYLLAVDGVHFNLTRSFDGQGMPTTTLHFGFNHTQGNYRVWYRSGDGKALMQDQLSHQASVVPPIPWAVDFKPGAGDTLRPVQEHITAGAVTINQLAKLLTEVNIDQSQYYRIQLAGLKGFNGHTVYDLTMQNVQGDPNEHPLRELLVDTQSFRAWQEVLQIGQHQQLFGGFLVLSASFGPVGQYWLNTSGSITGGGHYAFLHLNGSYDFQLSNFAFPARLPDWYFDASRFTGKSQDATTASL